MVRMNIKSLQGFPQSLERVDIEKYLSVYDGKRVPFGTWKDTAPLGWHESLTRSYQILEKVKDLLRKETPQDVILEIIEECER